jgi:hypothetical protein
MGSPAWSTFERAVEKGFLSLPTITAGTIRKYRTTSLATAKGHLDQTRQGQRPSNSKQHRTLFDEETLQDMFPDINAAAQLPIAKSKTVLVRLVEARHLPTGTNFTDGTGRFPVTSQRGHSYCLIMYCDDGNYIHVELMKSRRGAAYVEAYANGINFFRARGINPRFERLDNETSGELEGFLKAQRISIQYVAPNQHRTNKAERAIRTFKNHFVAILSGTDPDFPVDAWDLLIPQAELTLNLLRASRVNPYISAYQQLHGQYNFEQAPIAPPGIKVLIHEKPQQRESWAPRGGLVRWTGTGALSLLPSARPINQTSSNHRHPVLAPASHTRTARCSASRCANCAHW